MSGVVQHKSVISTAQNPTITLDSPVSEGNMLLAVIAAIETNLLVGLGDNGGNEDSSPYTGNQYDQIQEDISGSVAVYSYAATVTQAGSLTFEAFFETNDGEPKHIHLFEVAGYDTIDKLGGNTQSGTSSPSCSITSTTSKANEFVFAIFLGSSHPDDTFTAGNGYTAGELTNASGFSLFTEYNTISSTGEPTATANIGNGSDNVASQIFTFYDSSDQGGGDSGSGTGTEPVFLGSVVQDDSEPLAGEVFIGTVEVVESGPGGNNGPFLGSVKVRNSGTGYTSTSAHGGPHYPWIGQVVIVESGPDGATLPSLGLVDTQ